ncbi:MAG: 50S ribosomal protein L6 [Verrucomicrobia bacterium]|nr:50S ribosomal protein L6 [Verrucomicrobiota bacterium]MBS0635939.1 50S ribosomal protein L6 [Verrucomicrobiota bacterium]
MSRKGKAPITLPKGVDVQVKDNEIIVKGPKGSLHQALVPGVVVNVDNGIVTVSMTSEERALSKFHGLYRALINNMVIGTTQGFETKLEMIGVGYRAAVQGTILDLQVGNSHPTQLPIPTGIAVKVEKNTQISVTGINKQAVGQFAAQIRAHKKPEPYQGKGIRYEGEFVRKKAGKAAKTAKK